MLEHDAHAPGHAALHLPEDHVLVAGDMLSDVEVPLLDLKSGAPDPLGDYEAGLTVLEHVLQRGCRVVVPGHGAVATGGEVVTRAARDRSYLHALRRPGPLRDHRLDPHATYGADCGLSPSTTPSTGGALRPRHRLSNRRARGGDGRRRSA